MLSSYLEKHAYCAPQIAAPAHRELGIVVVIPCFDEPDVAPCIESLWRCKRPECAVEIMFVVNASASSSEEARERNTIAAQTIRRFCAAHSDDRFCTHVLEFPALRPKDAGVGLARKIGMDEAVARLSATDDGDGIIVGFDADCVCAPTYLQAIERHFSDHPRTPACSIHFEHPIEGSAYEARVYQGIIRYELFLRTHVHGLRMAGYPYAFQTVGSSMAVRAQAYQRQGGMNRRKAGEDFYFLQKMMLLGNYTELVDTLVIPAPRRSERVPFGTGKAIGQWLDSGATEYGAYNPATYSDLGVFCRSIDRLFDIQPEELSAYFLSMPESIRAFFDTTDIAIRLTEIQANSATSAAFIKRFHRWFSGLKALQFVHFARDRFYPNVAVENAAAAIARRRGFLPAAQTPWNAATLLGVYRDQDRAAPAYDWSNLR